MAKPRTTVSLTCVRGLGHGLAPSSRLRRLIEQDGRVLAPLGCPRDTLNSTESSCQQGYQALDPIKI